MGLTSHLSPNESGKSVAPGPNSLSSWGQGGDEISCRVCLSASCPQSYPSTQCVLRTQAAFVRCIGKPLCKGPHVYSESRSLTRACQFITHASDVPGEQGGRAKMPEPSQSWGSEGDGGGTSDTRSCTFSQKQLETWPHHKEMQWIREMHRSEVWAYARGHRLNPRITTKVGSPCHHNSPPILRLQK